MKKKCIMSLIIIIVFLYKSINGEIRSPPPRNILYGHTIMAYIYMLYKLRIRLRIQVHCQSSSLVAVRLFGAHFQYNLDRVLW